jgi:hypothetical protein
MSEGTKENIGDIILYKSKSELGGELKNERFAIYSADSIVPNTIGFIEYPIKYDSKIYPPVLISKFGKMGVLKNQQKESEEYLQKAGDWCFAGKVSKDEMGELERIAKAVKIPSHEDLSPPSTFH